MAVAYRNVPDRTSLNDVCALWDLVDGIHVSIQRLQQILVTSPAHDESAGETRSLDALILLAVRLDLLLIDFCNTLHAFLQRTPVEPDEGLPQMRQESEGRVRKCLKLAA